MKLKICGMREAGNIREVAALGPDYIGFIFYPKSKRYVGEDFTMPEISSSIKKVGVFVNDSLENIYAKVKKYDLGLVQLHGDESPEFCKRAGEKAKVIKAFGLPCHSDPASAGEESFSFDFIKPYEDCCDFFLFDAKTPEYGGSGKSFDAALLKNYTSSKPFFLSGGVGMDNFSLLQTPHSLLFAFDVNSRFEISPGLKDITKLKLLFDELSGK